MKNKTTMLPIDKLRKAPPSLAVLGVGAIEQHGPHLPVGTDWIIAQELSRRLAKKLNAVLLPAIPFSASACHGYTAGTVWLRDETLALLVEDIVKAVYQWGVHKLIIINCHGGNFILFDVIDNLNIKYQNFCVMLTLELPQVYRRIFSKNSFMTDVHAGEVETSLMLAINEQLVNKERAASNVPTVGREFLDYVTMDKISLNGVWGKAKLASKSKGEEFLKELEATFIKIIKNLGNS